MLPTERLAYSPIAQRKPLKLPGGARMAVWTVVNVEEWDIKQPMPRTVLTPPAGGTPTFSTTVPVPITICGAVLVPSAAVWVLAEGMSTSMIVTFWPSFQRVRGIASRLPWWCMM